MDILLLMVMILVSIFWGQILGFLQGFLQAVEDDKDEEEKPKKGIFKA